MARKRKQMEEDTILIPEGVVGDEITPETGIDSTQQEEEYWQDPIVVFNKEDQYIDIRPTNTLYSGMYNFIYTPEIIQYRREQGQYMDMNLANSIFLNRVKFSLENTISEAALSIVSFAELKLGDIFSVSRHVFGGTRIDLLIPDFKEVFKLENLAPCSPNFLYPSTQQVMDLAVYIVTCIEPNLTGLLKEKIYYIYLDKKDTVDMDNISTTLNYKINETLFGIYPVMIQGITQVISMLIEEAHKLFMLASPRI